MTNPLQPDAALLCKLGSIAVHAEEFMSPDGHDFDRVALKQLIADPDVVAWVNAMGAMAMIPKKRK